jgi:hypothetical protein
MASIPAPRGPRIYPRVNWSSGAGCSPRRGIWSGTTGFPVGLHFGRKLLKYGGKVNTLLITQISKDDYADLPDFPMHFVSA